MLSLLLPNVYRRLLLLVVFVTVFSVEPANGQKRSANSPKYDFHSETKIKGTVEDLKLPPKGSEKEIAHLMLKTGAEAIDVYLCPGSFLHDLGVEFKKGEEIALTGSKVKQDAGDLILAREVVKGNDTLVLRDDKGNPVWGSR